MPKIFHVTVGNEDWEPTEDELKNIANLFAEAVKDDKPSVVATRYGVAVEIFDIENTGDVKLLVEKFEG